MLHPVREFLQLGFLHEGFAEVPGREPPQLLGDFPDLAVVHAQGQAGVAHGTASAVTVLHAHQRDAFGAEALKDLPVDVVPFGAFDVDVDVRQGGTVAGEEAFKDEVVLERVHLADVDQVVDQAGGARTARGRPDAQGQDHPGDLCDGQEVRGEAQRVDDPELVLQPGTQLLFPLPGNAREAAADAGLTPQGQFGERVAVDPDHGCLRDHGLFPAHVSFRIHAAAVRERLGLGQEPFEVRCAVAGGVDNLLAQLQHPGRRFEPALPVGLQQGGGGELGEGFQRPGRVQHIGSGRAVLSHVPHGVAQHGRHPVFCGEFEHAHRVGGAQRFPGRAELGHNLCRQRSGGHGVQPAFEQGAGPQVAPATHGPADVGVRADQHCQDRLQGVRVQGAGGQFRPGDGHRHYSLRLARGAGVGVGDQPAQGPVAGTVVVSVSQHDDASPELGAVVAVVVKDRKVHPDDCIQPGCHARLQVLDGSIQAVSVRAGQRGGAVSGGRGGKFIRPGDAIVGAERGGDVQVGKAHADSGFRRGWRASWIFRSRHRPLPTCRVRSRVRVESAA